MKKSYIVEIDELFGKRAIVASILLHGLIMVLRFDFEPIRVETRTDAIEVTMVSPEVLKKHKALITKSDLKATEVLKEKPKEKVITGTQKVIPNATELGNPKAKEVVKNVQKGDPMSTDKSKYKEGTDFQKLRATNIGSGSSGSTTKTDSAGGSGDTYKGLDFSTKSLTNTGQTGQRFKIKNVADDMGAGAGKTGGIGNGLGKGFGDGTITGTNTGTVDKAKILTNVGSLTGAVSGAISSSRGAEGLGKKGTIMLAGTPEDTVVLGSMDPNIIRSILLEHLAQFRYCYQSELDRAGSDEASGVLQLNFDIGLIGSVTRANVSGPANVTSQVKDCMVGVLKGISFPKPKGGGKVEVKQPLNLYPRKV